MNVVRAIEKNPTNPGDKPKEEVVISDSGILPVDGAEFTDKAPSKE